MSASPVVHDPANALLREIWRQAQGPAEVLEQARFSGSGDLPSVFATTDLAVASIGAAGAAIAELTAARFGAAPAFTIDRRLASFWFISSIRPQGWEPPPSRDVVTGDYAARDGWIRLHTNAPHHQAAALKVLGVPADRARVAQAVATWEALALESAVVAAGGCAAQMRSVDAWAAHPQGQAVAGEPLLQVQLQAEGARADWAGTAARPLAGVRVLDLTRILAGPVATRFLAGFGAQVLRIDPVDWEEPGLAPEVTLGKRCARLDLHAPEGRARFEQLLQGADVLVHGYRSDALERLGYGAAQRQALRPGLVDVSLDAYGHAGPWRARRGFDSLVQMSSGIAEAGMRLGQRDKPTPLPVQGLDHATGYLLACAVVRGLSRRLRDGRGSITRASLARTAGLLLAAPVTAQGELAQETATDCWDEVETTVWGPAHRLLPPLAVAGAAMHWEHPAGPLGAAPASW